MMIEAKINHVVKCSPRSAFYGEIIEKMTIEELKFVYSPDNLNSLTTPR